MITMIKTEGREEWKALRHKYIGGSDAAACVGLNPYKSAYALWAEKTNKVAPFEGNLATEMGAYLEDFIAKLFERETGKKVRRNNRSILNDEYPWAIANVDREIIGEDAGLECKSTSELNLKRFNGGEYPANYYAQCMHYLAVTGKQRWYLAVLVGNREFFWFVIERDKAEIAALMEAEKDMKENHIDKDVPPDVDGSGSTSDTIAELYPDSNGESVMLTAFTSELEKYTELNTRIKELTELKDETANKIKAFMGESEIGESEIGEGDGYKVSWKSGTRNVFDHKRYAEDHPDEDLSGYFNVISSRSFRVTKRKIKQ